MLHFLNVSTLLVLCIPASLSQVPGKRCSAYNVNVVQDFNLKKYEGKWYEYKRFPTIFETNQGCVTANYMLENGNLTIFNSAKRLGLLRRKPVSIKGVAYPANPNSKEAKLKVDFFNTSFLSVPTGDYWVIGTDYTTYSVVWSCRLRLQFLWVLVRNLAMINQVESMVNKIIDDAEIDRSKLRITKNDANTCGIF